MIQPEQNFNNCDEETIQLLNLNIIWLSISSEGTMTDFYFSGELIL